MPRGALICRGRGNIGLRHEAWIKRDCCSVTRLSSSSPTPSLFCILHGLCAARLYHESRQFLSIVSFIRFHESTHQVYSSCCSRPYTTCNSSLFLLNPRRRCILAGLKLQRWEPNVERVDRRLDWNLPWSQRRCLEH